MYSSGMPGEFTGMVTSQLVPLVLTGTVAIHVP